MADPIIIDADPILYLTAWYRAALEARPEPYCSDVEVDSKEPQGTFPARLLVITDGGGVTTSFLTWERTFNFSVLAGTTLDPQDARNLSLMVHALRSQIPAAGFATDIDGTVYRNPFTAVLDSNGPFDVAEEQDRARRLMNVTFAGSGERL